MTKIFLYANRKSKGQKSCVPQVVWASKSGCVTKVKNQNHHHSFRVARLSQSASSQAKRKPTPTAKTMECVNPRWISNAETVSVKYPAAISKSGMVPAIAPKDRKSTRLNSSH